MEILQEVLELLQQISQEREGGCNSPTFTPRNIYWI